MSALSPQGAGACIRALRQILGLEPWPSCPPDGSGQVLSCLSFKRLSLRLSLSLGLLCAFTAPLVQYSITCPQGCFLCLSPSFFLSFSLSQSLSHVDILLWLLPWHTSKCKHCTKAMRLFSEHKKGKC